MARLQIAIDPGGNAPRLSEELHAALGSDAQQLVTPLVHPRYRRNHERARDEPMTRSDLLLNSAQWGDQVLGKLSPWLQLDSPHTSIRRRSEEAFKQEVMWATHLTVGGLLLPPPPPACTNYARQLQWAALAAAHLQLLVRVPLCAPEPLLPGLAEDDEMAEAGTAGDAAAAGEGAWAAWDRLRTLCEMAPSVGVALELGPDLPDSNEELERWCGEPVRAVLLPTSAFLLNKKGFPTLSRSERPRPSPPPPPPRRIARPPARGLHAQRPLGDGVVAPRRPRCKGPPAEAPLLA